MEGRGTPDQSQAGPGEPPRDTTLRTSVHTQLADGEQGTPYNTYSPYRAWVDLEAGAAAAQSAGSARSATGAAASAAFLQGRLPVPHERLGAASTAPTNMATPSGVMPPNQVRPRMEGGTAFGTFNMAGSDAPNNLSTFLGGFTQKIMIISITRRGNPENSSDLSSGR